jgi:glucose/arabinose dehydrogenase
MKPRHIVLLLMILAALVGAWLWLTREHAKLPEAALYGPEPVITSPRRTLLPTVMIPKAVGWEPGEAPTAAPGLKVNLFAGQLDHPRWLTVLPNGDVLVAETNSPKRSGGGFQGWIMRLLMGRAGADVPSANRITLLRDANGDGVAESRSALLTGLNSPFGMALVGAWLWLTREHAKLPEAALSASPSSLAKPGSAPSPNLSSSCPAAATIGRAT